MLLLPSLGNKLVFPLLLQEDLLLGQSNRRAVEICRLLRAKPEAGLQVLLQHNPLKLASLACKGQLTFFTTPAALDCQGSFHAPKTVPLQCFLWAQQKEREQSYKEPLKYQHPSYYGAMGCSRTTDPSSTSD